SGGRVVLGIGAGWVAAESAALGVPFAERGAMTDEYLAAMQELWTSRAPSFAGKYTRFGGLVFEPKPLQKPHPPIWAGGHSRGGPAARVGQIGELAGCCVGLLVLEFLAADGRELDAQMAVFAERVRPALG